MATLSQVRWGGPWGKGVAPRAGVVPRAKRLPLWLRTLGPKGPWAFWALRARGPLGPLWPLGDPWFAFPKVSNLEAQTTASCTRNMTLWPHIFCMCLKDYVHPALHGNFWVRDMPGAGWGSWHGKQEHENNESGFGRRFWHPYVSVPI